MENKINITELLKDCPSGMELDCTMFDDVKFIEIEDDDKPICIRTGDIYRYLTKFGTWTFDENAKCVIFPKGKTTWEGFQRPFKDGDIIYTKTHIAKLISIFEKFDDDECKSYIDYSIGSDTYYGRIGYKNTLCEINNIVEQRLATEEEKQKLFDVIKTNGYKWNPKTKTLEKLPRFKVGNKIKSKTSENIFTVIDIRDGVYILSHTYDKFSYHVPFRLEKDYELVPNKFDITTLKPFDKVLIRDRDTDEWNCHFFSYYYKTSDRPYICIGCEGLNEYKQCIPYEGNEHLLGTTNDCIEYYKTW